jgi:GntR family transcriptional regulator
MLAFQIQPHDTTPIYRQIVDQVQRRVSSGQWKAGDELPSVRALAALHTVNPMTISKAYALLEEQGWLERRRGLGMVVADRRATPTVDRWEQLMPTLEAAARQAGELGLKPEAVLKRLAHLMERRAEAQQQDPYPEGDTLPDQPAD